MALLKAVVALVPACMLIAGLRLAGPSFDTMLALEFLGFRLSDAHKGLNANPRQARAAFRGARPCEPR